jgi:hypothetical protein
MSSAPAHSLRPVTDSKLRQGLLRAVSSYELRNDRIGKAIKQAIARFDPDTSFDGLDGLPEGIFDAGDGKFEVVGSLFLKFPNGDPAETARAIIKARYEDGKARIEDIVLRMPNT